MQPVRGEMSKRPTTWIPDIQTARSSTDPQETASVLVDRHDVAVAQAFRGLIIDEALEFARFAVEQVKAVGSPDPGCVKTLCEE